MRKLRLGTRGSRLALWQSEYVAEMIRYFRPDTLIEIEIIKTTGDQILDVALSKIGDKGLFTKEIENSLLSGHIDLAVHSMKDLPSELPPGLSLGAVLKRENPQDVFISHKNYTLANLPPQSRVGTSSLRRIAQLRAVRPDLYMINMRGNVETRIRKMQEEDLDGIILAYAGVARLGFDGKISEVISTDLILPAVGQGAIAVEIRSDDYETEQVIAAIDDCPTHFATRSERSLLRELEGGCQVPIASLARVENHVIYLEGLVASMDGQNIIRGSRSGNIQEADEIGILLAQDLLTRGADRILDEIKRLGE